MVLDSPERIHWRFLFINFCLFFQSLGLGSWFTQVFCHSRNWIQKDETPPSSKRKRKSCSSTLQPDSAFIKEAVESFVEEVREVKEEIGKICELAFRRKFSLSFIRSFEEAFRCSISHVTPARLPLVAC